MVRHRIPRTLGHPRRESINKREFLYFPFFHCGGIYNKRLSNNWIRVVEYNNYYFYCLSFLSYLKKNSFSTLLAT